MQALTDAQWQKIQLILDKPRTETKGGRPRSDDRRTLNGVLWVLLNGAQWSQMPKVYGSYVTCWRRFKEWESTGVWGEIFTTYMAMLNRSEQTEWMLALMDGKFVPGKKGK